VLLDPPPQRVDGAPQLARLVRHRQLARHVRRERRLGREAGRRRARAERVERVRKRVGEVLPLLAFLNQ
jgi:hypothetical protein